jgi:hypothetical protein
VKRNISVRFLAAPALVAGGLAVLPPAHARPPQGSGTLPFEELSLFIEWNSVDGDTELMLKMDADVGLKSLKVVGPNGKKVVGLTARGNPNIGQRKVELESPEPTPGAVFAAFPEGPYQFHGRSVDDEKLFGEVTLSHALLDPVTITSPASGATNVPINGVTADWTPTPGVTRYIVEVEEEDDETNSLVVDLPGTRTSFTLPDGWLLPDTTYQLAVGAVGPTGNVTVYEHFFTTEP